MLKLTLLGHLFYATSFVLWVYLASLHLRLVQRDMRRQDVTWLWRQYEWTLRKGLTTERVMRIGFVLLSVGFGAGSIAMLYNWAVGKSLFSSW